MGGQHGTAPQDFVEMNETLTDTAPTAAGETATSEGVFTIAPQVRQAMIEHALAEVPDEACGLLAGGDGRAERFFAMENADHSPMTFRLDPNEQLKVFNQIDDLGLDLVGIFHSHTHTEAYPSATDRRLAFYPEARYVLVSVDGSEPVLRAFTIRDGEVKEQEVRFE